MSNWQGILEIIEIRHFRIQGNEILWVGKNLKNVLHYDGEEFVLKIVFSNFAKPDYYYFGLDDRAVLSISDTLSDLEGEPTSHGYERQAVDSNEGWNFSLVGSQTIAKSPVLTFSAVNGSIGPVRNIFMTNQSVEATPTADDYLISSIYLGQNLTIASGEAVSLRMAVKLRECST